MSFTPLGTSQITSSRSDGFTPLGGAPVSFDQSQAVLASSQKSIDQYRQEAAQAQQQAQQAQGEAFTSPLDVIPNMTGGVIKDVTQNLQGLGKLAMKGITSLIPGQIGKTLQGSVDNSGFSDESLKAKNPAEMTGKVLGEVGQFAIPGVEGAKVVGATEAGGKLLQGAGKLAVGKEGMKTLEQLSNDEAQKFIKGGKTVSDVAQGTQSAIDKFINTSKASLKAVKDAIPHIDIEPQKIAEKVNQGVMDSIRKNAEYKGMNGEVESIFKSPKDLIDSGLLNEEEVNKVKGMIKVISNWKDTSARGVLNLKEQIGSFYKDGLGNSNAILSNIQKGLKDIVGETHPDIKPALEKASENIDKAEEFQRNLIGKDTIQGETKLSSLARSINNPARSAEKFKLLDELKTLTGHDATPELQGYHDFLKLLEKGGGEVKDIPTKTGTILKEVGKRLGIGAGIGVGLEELKKLFGD